MSRTVKIMLKDVLSEPQVTLKNIWAALDEKTVNPKVQYLIDFKDVKVPKRIENKHYTALLKKNNVGFRVYDTEQGLIMQAVCLVNSNTASRVEVVENLAETVQEVLHKSDVQIETINRIIRQFTKAENGICYIDYLHSVEVDEAMLDTICETIKTIIFDKIYPDITKVVLRFNAVKMERAARFKLWEILKKRSVEFNNIPIEIDLSVVQDVILKRDLVKLMEMKQLDITPEERLVFFNKLPKGLVGLWTKYLPRTRGSGNLSNAVFRDISEISLARIAIFKGIEQESNGNMAVFAALDAAKENDMCMTEDEFYHKYNNDRSLKRPNIHIIEERVPLITLGYDKEFTGNRITFTRFDPSSKQETIINNEVVTVSDAYYAKLILDSYNLQYNVEELNKDIMLADKR